MQRLAERVSLATFVATCAISIYVFVVAQILQAYPFYHLGAFGNQPFVFLTYVETVEAAGPLSMLCFAVWQYKKSALAMAPAAARAVGRTFLVFGGAVGAVVYGEIHLVWGELWYGVHVWPSLPGGGGYPWGDEQVAYNLCFIKEGSYTPQVPNCSFLNYNWLLGLAVSAFLVGLVIELYFRSNPGERSAASTSAEQISRHRDGYGRIP